MKPAVEFRDVSKHYFLGSRRAYLRYLLPDSLSRPIDEKNSTGAEDLWALRHVSFSANPGEVVGLIGPNGAGKTTALSLLAGIMAPTSGDILLRGRVGALIKLGAGFHPDLTGRENVYLNGSILGMKRAEVDRLYEKIVDFAELGDFMDTPVKRYSSGMYVRLGFAVAVHVDPEILLVDEILSVGDVSFQARCLNRIGEICDRGTTVIFVSHNMHHIAGFCSRVIYLNKGEIACVGEPAEAIGRYNTDLMKSNGRTQLDDGSDMSEVSGTGRVIINDIRFLDSSGQEVEQIATGESVVLRIFYRAVEQVENPILDVAIRDSSRGNMFQATNRDYGVELGRMESSGHVDVRFARLPCNNQVLDFFVSFWNASHTERFDWKRFVKLRVLGKPTTSGRFFFECDWTHPVGSAQNGQDATPSLPTARRSL